MVDYLCVSTITLYGDNITTRFISVNQRYCIQTEMDNVKCIVQKPPIL